ncbi:hypothetical protein [Methanospirillum purgamenti]|uniref:hypothetical protein n=1 Tax=Methanospirillum purgamenti TaxID=2834276 RepID=UPI002A245194|nr:hypothetical protein [Methanospirillum hungatei]MDX8551939.1 hypothetical protein [Methanospirillum hungatei]
MACDRPGPWITRGTDRKTAAFASVWARGWKTERKVCIECGDVFVPWRKDQVYCHHSCRQRAYRRRHGLITHP